MTSGGGWQELERDGVRLAVRDHGGEGPPVLLLHGLAGHAGEWDETAAWLTPRHRVLALEARGHGRSERRPGDVSRAAHVADVAFAIERPLGGEPVVLVGQSLGGHAALLLAAEHPELVRALVLADAGPAPAPDPAAMAARVAGWLAAWPAPFRSHEAAVAFFAGEGMPAPVAAAWADGLEPREGGWWLRFDADVMERTLREAVALDLWGAWERIRCPTLVVRAGEGHILAEHAREMVERLPGTRLVELPGATHDLHLDRPGAWREALVGFLEEVAS